MTIDNTGKIILDTVIIDDKNIIVLGSNTSFSSQSFVEKIEINDIKSKIKDIAKIAKENKVTFKGKAKSLKSLDSSLSDYESDYAVYLTLFNELRTLAKLKVKKGIYAPTSDDLELNEMYEIRNKISRLFHGNNPMSVFRNIKYSVEQAFDFISTSSNARIVSISHF